MNLSGRGFGGRIGPVSAGTSWRGGRRASGAPGSAIWTLIQLALIALAIVVIAKIGWLFLTWPYRLGRSLSDGATGYVLAWAFEATYLIGLLSMGAFQAHLQRVAREHNGVDREHARLCDRHAAEIAELTAVRDRAIAALEQAPASLAAIADTLHRIDRFPEGLSFDQIDGLPDSLDRDARYLGCGKGWLSAPRVAGRGGPKVQTSIEAGTWVVTGDSIAFYGPTRSDRWPAARISSVDVDGDRLLFGLVNRKTVSGLQIDGGTEILRALVAWARAIPGDARDARTLLQNHLEEFDAAISELAAEIPVMEEAIGDLVGAPPVHPGYAR